MLQQECCPANYNLPNEQQEEYITQQTGSADLPPGIKRQRHVAVAKADHNQNIGLNESVDLFLSDSQPITSTTGNGNQSSTASCSIPSVQSISSASSLLLLPFSMATGSPEEVQSSRETASPPCMTVATARCFETTAAVRTRNTYKEETYERLQAGNDAITTGNNKVSFKSNSTSVKPHVANTLPTPAATMKTFVERKKGNEIFTSVSPSSATNIKCSKNSDYNIKCKEIGSDGQRQNFQQTKTLSRGQQIDPEISQQSKLPHRMKLQQIPEIAARCENSARKCKKALEAMNQLLHANRIENFWHQWTLQEMGLHISQSEYNATVTPESVRTRCSNATHAAYAHRPSIFTPKSGNIKSTKQPTESARSWSSPPAYARTLASTSCQARGSYDRPAHRQPSLIQSRAVKGNTPIASTTIRNTIPMSSPAKSSFQGSRNSCFQNYTRQLPAVRMARKVRDDPQCGRAYQPEGDRRRDRSNTPPRRARPRSPSPDRLECVFCGLISHQRRNHRRHLILKHNCRPDGTPATVADIEEARREEPEPPTSHSARYKSRKFIESDSDDDTTPIGSGASMPSDRRSSSPSRSSRQKRTRSESSGSSSLQRDTRRVVARQPVAPSPTTSRTATPPRSAPPVRKQVRRVRFERGETTETEGESSTTTQKKPVKPPARAKRPTTATRKDKKAKVEEHPIAETEVQPTAATSARELLVSTPKIDAMTEIAKQAVLNLKTREVGVKFKEPLAKPEKGKQPPPKRHQHPLPASRPMSEKEKQRHLVKSHLRSSRYRHKMFLNHYFRLKFRK